MYLRRLAAGLLGIFVTSGVVAAALWHEPE